MKNNIPIILLILLILSLSLTRTYTDVTITDGNISTSGDINYNVRHTFLYFEDSTITPTVTTSGDYVQVTNGTNNLFTVGESTLFTISGDTIYPADTGDYFIQWDFSIEGDNGFTFLSRANNNIVCKGKKAATGRGAGNYVPLTGFTYCHFSAGEYLVIEYTSTSGDKSATFIDGTIFMIKIHD